MFTKNVMETVIDNWKAGAFSNFPIMDKHGYLPDFSVERAIKHIVRLDKSFKIEKNSRNWIFLAFNREFLRRHDSGVTRKFKTLLASGTDTRSYPINSI